jgi:excisionase family DNA binding protein
MQPSSHSWKSTPATIAYSIPEAMTALRISRATIYELINDGMLRTYRIGRRRFCTHDAIVECQKSLEANS